MEGYENEREYELNVSHTPQTQADESDGQSGLPNSEMDRYTHEELSPKTRDHARERLSTNSEATKRETMLTWGNPSQLFPTVSASMKISFPPSPPLHPLFPSLTDSDRDVSRSKSEGGLPCRASVPKKKRRRINHQDYSSFLLTQTSVEEK